MCEIPGKRLVPKMQTNTKKQGTKIMFGSGACKGKMMKDLY